jgi:hypothetical protein
MDSQLLTGFAMKNIFNYDTKQLIIPNPNSARKARSKWLAKKNIFHDFVHKGHYKSRKIDIKCEEKRENSSNDIGLINHAEKE